MNLKWEKEIAKEHALSLLGVSNEEARESICILAVSKTLALSIDIILKRFHTTTRKWEFILVIL